LSRRQSAYGEHHPSIEGELRAMTDLGPEPVVRSPTGEHLAHAAFHARESPAGIGASVTRSGFDDGRHIWDAAVTDGHEWHYIRVVGSDLGPYPALSAEDIEESIERFAATLPERYRIRHLINANPLHVDRDGKVHD
jgi:hypothetical protein